MMDVLINGVRYVPAPYKVAINKPFGECIRICRKQVDMTLDQLAKRAGLSKSTVWELENGRHLPSFVVAIRLANALMVPIEMLAVASDVAAAEAPKGAGRNDA
jgi:transcriptional regulator with XRE-family HTH domain